MARGQEKSTGQGGEARREKAVGMCAVKCVQGQKSPPRFKSATNARLTLIRSRLTLGLSFPMEAILGSL